MDTYAFTNILPSFCEGVKMLSYMKLFTLKNPFRKAIFAKKVTNIKILSYSNSPKTLNTHQGDRIEFYGLYKKSVL